jgi:hypothetical protein
VSRRRTSFAIRCWQLLGTALLVVGAMWAIGAAADLVAAKVGGR